MSTEFVSPFDTLFLPSTSLFLSIRLCCSFFVFVVRVVAALDVAANDGVGPPLVGADDVIVVVRAKNGKVSLRLPRNNCHDTLILRDVLI